MGCRWLVCPALVLALGCSSTESGPRRVDIGGLQFDLPAELQYQADGWVSSVEAVDGFYSNVELGAACQVVGNSGSCGSPLTTMPERAVLLSWGNTSGFGPTSASNVPNTSIAGQPATITIERPGTCFGLHADESITAVTDQPGSTGDFKMQACLRGPDLAASERLVTVMLDSVTIG